MESNRVDPYPIRYFGYGAMKLYDMVEAVIGRGPSGTQVYVVDHELIIQSLRDIPEGVRESLEEGWGQDFRAYRLRPTEKVSGRISVLGVVWDITPEELELIKNWEGNGRWTQTVSVEAYATHHMVRVPAVSEAVPTGSTGEGIYGTFSLPGIYLNGREKMIAVAVAEREKFLREVAPQREIILRFQF